MSKYNLFSNPGFQTQTVAPNKFNLVTQTSTFNAVFDTKPLEKSEEDLIEKMLIDNFKVELITEEQARQDIHQLKLMTAEIKAIGQQGAVLMGERIYKAREILKSYKDGTFTRWLESTLGSRKTGYNLLAYYELYISLPDEGLKQEFKKIPQKAAYILASREGDIQKKSKAISNYQNLRSQEIISLIQADFPISQENRKNNQYLNKKLIHSLRETIKKIHVNKKYLSKEDIFALHSLKMEIDNILS